ncbi:MAG: Gfo/Idh/MocA family protein [Thermoproteota archaeon]
MRKIGFGIIGCGGIANYFHLPELCSIEEVDVVAVADIKENRAKITAGKFKVPNWYTDYRELLEREDVEAVVVATPHPTHSPITIDAIKAGKHVIIQKPMTTKVKDAETIVEYVKKHRNLKVMALPFVYFDNPYFDHVKKLILNGGLGKVCMARIRVAHSGPEGYQDDVARMFDEETGYCWFFDKEKADGGAMFDMGVYSFTLATLLFGKVKRLVSLIDTLDKKASVEDSAATIMKTEMGSMVVAETAWTQARGANEIIIYGVKGLLVWEDLFGNPVIKYYDSSSSSWNMPFLQKEKEPQHTHRHFVKSILEDTQPIGTAEEGKYLVELMEAAQRSSEKGEAIDFY